MSTFKPSLLLVFLFSLNLSVHADELTTFRFDLGTEKSPVAARFTRVTAQSAYSAASKFGWMKHEGEGFDRQRPERSSAWDGPGGQLIPRDYIIYKEHNDVTRDGISSEQDLVFRVDLPNGDYRVAITLGDLERAICSQQIYLNDRLVGNVDAKHFARRGGPDHQYGFPRKVRRTVSVAQGLLTIRIHGDDTGFHARFLEEYEKPPPVSYLRGDPVRREKPAKPDATQWGVGKRGQRIGGSVWVWEDIGGPFTQNSLMAIEVYPFVKPPLWIEEGKLAATVDDAQLQRAVGFFNQGRFEDSQSAFDDVSDDYSRALGHLWLSGHPNYEKERALLPKVLDAFERLGAAKRHDLMFAENLESARRLDKAVYRFDHKADQQRTYNELLLISGEVLSMQPGDPTYYKGLIYAGRGYYTIIPHRWAFAAGAGRQQFEKVRAGGFGDNRFVRWYLDEHWSEHPPDWVYADYSASKAGAPRWAAEVYEAYNRELDLTSWWMQNRQASDGSMGGGWGDDVEILRSFGIFGSICSDASPSILDGIRRLANGAWNSGSVDTDAGYFAEVGDTEHTGEWTADTLVPMIHIDYGNPVFIERGMKTARLMRDLWMDFNSRGHYWIRSNFLGATGVGVGPRANESRINYRPALPARAVLWYNGSPTIEKLYLQWADAWLDVSMSTDRGKPRGIIPQEIAFEGSRIGGVNAPHWYKADRPPGTVNYDYRGAGGYHDYIVDLFLYAYETTGDRKYLEPMQLESEYALEHCPPKILESLASPSPRPLPFFIKELPAGSTEWLGAQLAPWPAQWENIRRVMFPDELTDQGNLWSLTEVADMAAREVAGARRRWPQVTTECIATDRVSYPGMAAAARVMTGLKVLGQDPLVTYRGLGRDFAAAVLKVDRSFLRVVLFNIANENKAANIISWLFEPGTDYGIKIGPDRNDDGKMDAVEHERALHVARRGQEIEFQLPARSQYVVEARRIGSPKKRSRSADLGLSRRDVVFVPQYRRVEVTIHNVGSKGASGVEVALLEGKTEVGRQTIPHIAAPLDLDPKSVRIHFGFLPTKPKHAFTVIVDPADSIKEITDRNNRLQVTLETPLKARKRHSHP